MEPLLISLLVVLLIGTGVGKAVADAQAHGSGRLTAWFPKWAGPDAWRNKYRNYYLDTKTPAFWGSKTVFVFATDIWHFANLVTWACWAAAVLLSCWLGRSAFWYAVAGLVAGKLLFEPLYKFLRKSI